MRIPTPLTIAFLLLIPPVSAVAGQSGAPDAGFTYADLADRAITAPLALSATIVRATQLKKQQAEGVPEGQARFYVEATVTTLIRGAAGLSSQISYLVDVPLDTRGKPPKLRKAAVLLLARPVEGKPGEVQLVTPDAQLPLTPDNEARVRAILAEALKADAPPRITGIGSAFHVPGSLPGEGETQIFLSTADKRPVSLNILRRPGEQARWAVALSEIVDEAAAPPPPDTLLWYRLACTLPPALPPRATRDLAPEDAQLAAEDYRVVIEGLGRCARNHRIRR